MTKVSTQIKNIMVKFVAENGLTDINTISTNGIQFDVLSSTRFHYGQIKITHPEYGAWIADYNKSGALGVPKQIVQTSTGAWVPASHPLARG